MQLENSIQKPLKAHFPEAEGTSPESVMVSPPSILNNGHSTPCPAMIPVIDTVSRAIDKAIELTFPSEIVKFERSPTDSGSK